MRVFQLATRSWTPFAKAAGLHMREKLCSEQRVFPRLREMRELYEIRNPLIPGRFTSFTPRQHRVKCRKSKRLRAISGTWIDRDACLVGCGRQGGSSKQTANLPLTRATRAVLELSGLASHIAWSARSAFETIS